MNQEECERHQRVYEALVAARDNKASEDDIRWLEAATEVKLSQSGLVGSLHGMTGQREARSLTKGVWPWEC